MKTREQYLQENISAITNYLFHNPFDKWIVKIDNKTTYSYGISDIAKYLGEH